MNWDPFIQMYYGKNVVIKHLDVGPFSVMIFAKTQTVQPIPMVGF